MRNDALGRTRFRFLYAVLIGIASTVAGLVVPSLLSASDTITCDTPPLIATAPTMNAQLGWSLSQDQGWLAAGANLDNAKAGSVALYLNPQPGARPTVPEIRPADLQPGDQFGSSVSVVGNWMAVGAPGKVQNSGAVYLFMFDGSSWVQREPKLTAADAAQGAQFGFSVSLSVSANGARLVVGAPGDSDRGSLAGSAYVFEMQGGAWSQTAELYADLPRPFDLFGSSVAIGEDGTSLVVGAPFADDLVVFKNFGAAYVFSRTGDVTGGWTLPVNGKLTAAETFRGDNIQFGASVAMSGNRILVGAPGDDLHNLTDSGSAFFFEKIGSDWVRLLSLTAGDPGQGEQFGSAVVIDSDRLLIGARFDGEGGANSGAAYLFDSGSGTQTHKIIRHAPGGAFGQSVAVLGDHVFMGGYLDDVGLVVDAGAVAVCPSSVQCPSAPSISRTDHQATVQPGQTVTYRIDVVEAPPDTTVSDMFPQGLEAVGWCRGANCTDFVPQPFSVILPVGGDATFLVRGLVLADATGTLIVKACLDVGVCPQACMKIVDTIPPIPPPPDLSCAKTGPDTAKPGDIVTYDITVSNFGSAAAKNVTLSDPIPAGLSLVSVSGLCTQLPCDLGTIRPGQTLPPVTAKFQVAGCPAPSLVTNLATVVGSNALEATCPKTTVVSSVPVVGISVSAPAQVAGGDSFNFSVVVTNVGQSTAPGVTVDVSIANAGIVEGIPPGCTLGSQPGHFTCLLGDLNCGASKTLIFSVRAPVCVTCAAGTPIVVTAEATSQTFDPILPKQATATISVTCAPPDLAITKTHEPAVLVPGQPMAYIITVRNYGPGDAPGATVIDFLPTPLLGPHCVGANGLDCTFLGNSLNVAVGPLPAGGEASYRIEGQLTSQCITNTATVSPLPGAVDCDLSNNTAIDTATVSPGVSIHCSGVSDAFEGDFVTFTYVLSNGGPNAQADNPGAEFTDTLPAGLTLVTATASSGTATTAANTVSWNGSIPVCGTVTINVQAKVNAGTVGMTLCNQGNVAFDANGDGVNESNASALCCVTIIPLVLPVPPIPALSGTGLAAFMILLVCVALLRLRRRAV
jgi:uncharacterized repeat protein (TIGR01451 family)